jgi:hypothetical protein
MKTQVIHLDPHDDVTAVRDKMSWAKSTRLLLVYPRRSRILARELDLRLIQRHAAALGVQLAIVAPLDDICETARELAIPVFKTPGAAQREDWKSSRFVEPLRRNAPPADLRQMRREVFPTEPRWRTLLGVRLAFFSAAVLTVLALLWLFVPAATIRLTPVTKVQDLTIAVRASSEVTSVNVSGSIPAHLTFTSLSQSKTAPVTGSITIPDGSAAGMIRFRNLTTSVVGIPAGTVVRTTGVPPIRFTTTSDAVVAAGVGKTMDVPVQALEAGASGNLASDTLVAIEGDLGTSLAVTNPGPTTGGTERKAPVQTADDRTKLHNSLEAELLEGCKNALPKVLSGSDIYFPDTASIAQVISETYFPAPGQTGDTLSLTMNVQCQAEYASSDDIQILTRLALNANLPAGFEPISGGGMGPTSLIGSPKTNSDGSTRWEVKATRLLQAKLDPLAAVALAQGRKNADAVSLLSNSLPLGSLPKILITPSWWPWLPVVPFRISVHLDRPVVVSE